MFTNSGHLLVLFAVILFLSRIKYAAAHLARFAIGQSTTGAILIATG